MSKYADAAFAWIKKNAPGGEVSTEELWTGLQSAHPELTEVREDRKTPRTTLMRDLRKDRLARFIVGGRRVKLS